MPDCDYCSASFDDEGSYYAHLGDEHADELGRIDRRRVDQHTGGSDEEGLPTGPLILFGVIAFALAVVVYVVVFFGGGSGNGGTGIEDPSLTPLPDSGGEAVISAVATEPSTGNAHVAQGTDIDYERVPPTSGTHYGRSTVSAGFYDQQRPLGSLVHSLEHGAVVVYYDPDRLSPEAEDSLKRYAGTFTGDWRSFIAVPNPTDDPEAAYVLTAWEKRLPMNSYNESTVRAFTAEYLGRGPENPVR